MFCIDRSFSKERLLHFLKLLDDLKKGNLVFCSTIFPQFYVQIKWALSNIKREWFCFTTTTTTTTTTTVAAAALHLPSDQYLSYRKVKFENKCKYVESSKYWS